MFRLSLHSVKVRERSWSSLNWKSHKRPDQIGMQWLFLHWKEKCHHQYASDNNNLQYIKIISWSHGWLDRVYKPFTNCDLNLITVLLWTLRLTHIQTWDIHLHWVSHLHVTWITGFWAAWIEFPTHANFVDTVLN